MLRAPVPLHAMGRVIMWWSGVILLVLLWGHYTSNFLILKRKIKRHYYGMPDCCTLSFRDLHPSMLYSRHNVNIQFDCLYLLIIFINDSTVLVVLCLRLLILGAVYVLWWWYLPTTTSEREGHLGLVLVDIGSTSSTCEHGILPGSDAHFTLTGKPPM